MFHQIPLHCLYYFPSAVLRVPEYQGSDAMGVLSKDFSPADKARGPLQPTLLQVFGLPRLIRLFPGVYAEISDSWARCLPRACASLPPDVNPDVISLLEQLVRGKRLPALGVSGTLREVVTELRLHEAWLAFAACQQ